MHSEWPLNILQAELGTNRFISTVQFQLDDLEQAQYL
jgi:hypothetical protein